MAILNMQYLRTFKPLSDTRQKKNLNRNVLLVHEDQIFLITQ